MNNNEFLTDWGLTLMVFLPVAGALVMLLIPKAEEEIHKWVALVAVLASAGVGAAVLADFNYDRTADLQFVVNNPWIDVIHARFFVGIDGLSVPLVALTLLVTPLCIVYSWNHFPEPRNPKAFLILLLVLQTGMIGTFVAQDLILFFVFFFPGIIALVWAGYYFAEMSWRFGERSMLTPSGPPLYHFKTVVPVAGFFTALQGVAEVMRAIIALRTGRWPDRFADVQEAP